MNLVQTISHIVRKLLPALRVKAGRGISVRYSEDGTTVECKYPQHPEAVAVWVTNTASTAMAAGRTVVLSGGGVADYLPPGNAPSPLDIAYNASIPAAGASDGVFAVLLEDIAAGMSGRAVIAGTATASLTNASGSGTMLAPDGTGRLSPSDSGSITPIYMDAQNSVAVVLLGSSGGKMPEVPTFFKIVDATSQDEDGVWHAAIKVTDGTSSLSYLQCGIFVSGVNELQIAQQTIDISNNGTYYVVLTAVFSWNQTGTSGTWDASLSITPIFPSLTPANSFVYVIGIVTARQADGVSETGNKVKSISQIHHGGAIYNNRYA